MGATVARAAARASGGVGMTTMSHGLKAGPGRCEEASPLSHGAYIPCNAPATVMVKHRGRAEGPYRMCPECASHNVKNRNAEIVGAIPAGDTVINRPPITMTPVDDLVRRATFDVPEKEQQALESDIQAQLASLPTVITDEDTYAAAKTFLPKLKQAEDKVLAFFNCDGDGNKEKGIKPLAYRVWKGICDKEGAALKPIKAARDRLAGLIYAWEQELQRLRREQELAESKRLQEQQQAQALEEAIALNDAGAVEMAEQVVEQAIAAPAPVVVLPSKAVRVDGVSIRENWTFAYEGASAGQRWKDLTDDQRKRVLQFIPREYLVPDEGAIGKVVKAMKSGARIPGVRAYDAGTVVVRG